MTVHSETESSPAFAQVLRVGEHTLRADTGKELGGGESAPSPHDYFDAALAACKTLTAHVYAKRTGMALERVEAKVTRDDSEERKGKYVLKVELTFHGALSDDERTRLHAAVAKCPLHKLMTTSEVLVETA